MGCLQIFCSYPIIIFSLFEKYRLMQNDAYSLQKYRWLIRIFDGSHTRKRTESSSNGLFFLWKHLPWGCDHIRDILRHHVGAGSHLKVFWCWDVLSFCFRPILVAPYQKALWI